MPITKSKGNRIEGAVPPDFKPHQFVLAVKDADIVVAAYVFEVVGLAVEAAAEFVLEVLYFAFRYLCILQKPI